MNLTFVVVLLLLLVFVGMLLDFVRRLVVNQRAVHPYVLRPSLFSPAERTFLGCLDSVLPPEIRVFAKVRLADLFEVKRTPDRSAWQSAFNKINSKHVDFVLCRSSDLHPLLVIELDDKSHAREDRRQRDALIESLFAASSLALIRFKVQRAYQPEEIAKRVNEALASPPNALH